MLQIVLALPPERFAAVYGALPPELSAALDGAIARTLNARLPSVRRQPVALRARALRAWIVRQHDDTIASDLLRAYFLGPRLALVTAFLDATGVAHDKGQIADDGAPAPDKVPAAVEALLAGHDRDDVRLYLAVAALQWPEIAALRKALDGLGPPAGAAPSA